MKKIISVFCVFASLALATEAYQNQAAIDSVAESINSRKGIEIGGTVRGISYRSDFSSKQEKLDERGSMTNVQPDVEVAEFVQLDLDFLFRPWDNVSANLKLRLGAGMQEYFAAVATTVYAPWMSIQGNAANGKFHWIVGDFRQLYSPLTLYAPSIDIMYEPTIFARKREIAMSDALLEGNQRNLQGFNLQLRQDFGETFGELRIEAMGARLRRAGFLDSSGAMGNILPNENIPGSLQAANFDKFLLGGNLEYLPLNKNILVGGSYLLTFDEERSALRRPNGNFINLNDTLPQSTHVFAGRAGVDIAGILNMPNLIANAVVEYAGSNDKTYNYVPVVISEPNEEDVETFEAVSKKVNGSALLASLDVGYKVGTFKAALSGKFINNNADWFNPLAQTSQFLPRRILNSDKDRDLTKYGVYSPLYSSFDALYNFTPKHSPLSSSLSNASLQQSSSYNIAPYAKSSWNAATFTRTELALLNELLDPNLQMALPGGLATANRVGATGTLTLGYGDYIEAKGLFSSLQDESALLDTKKADYMEYGGGAKVNVLGLLGFENNPLELSGSYKHSQKEQDWRHYGKSEFNSDFINAGFYWRFFKRFGLAAGYQRIDSDLNSAAAEVVKNGATTDWKVKIVPVAKSVQDQWMVGIDYTVAKNAWLSINYGIMSVENTYNMDGFVSDVDIYGNPNVDPFGNNVWKVVEGTNLPDYMAVRSLKEEVKELKHKFSRNMLEATINVEF